MEFELVREEQEPLELHTKLPERAEIPDRGLKHHVKLVLVWFGLVAFCIAVIVTALFFGALAALHYVGTRRGF